MEDLLLPALILVGLGIMGIAGGLIVYLTRGSGGGSKPTGSAVPKPSRSVGNAFLMVDRNDRGIWEVFVNGVSYRTLEAVPEEEERQRVIEAVRLLAAFSRQYLEKQKREKSQPKRVQAAARQLTPAPPGERLTIPRSTPERESPTVLRPAAPPSLLPQINFAQEVGEIVEDLQRRRPSLAARAIMLRNAPDGEIDFIIDGVVYRRPDDIPDLEIQALIREAIHIWEER
ncbi:MAG: hypothetical protein ACLFU8_04250 [Anaerolineales bacterium]